VGIEDDGQDGCEKNRHTLFARVQSAQDALERVAHTPLQKAHGGVIPHSILPNCWRRARWRRYSVGIMHYAAYPGSPVLPQWAYAVGPIPRGNKAGIHVRGASASFA
jgi:hypothetical protein